MKLKELKNILEQLTPEQLEKELIYNSEEFYISGPVKGLVEAKEDLYYTGEEDPSSLYTKNQLIENDLEDEIDGFEIEIGKGDFYIEL